MNAAQMTQNQRVADIANLLAAKQGQERAYDEIDVSLILRAMALYQFEIDQYRAAIGKAPHVGRFPWSGSGPDHPCMGRCGGRE